MKKSLSLDLQVASYVKQLKERQSKFQCVCVCV